jgi:hypothetical protein
LTNNESIEPKSKNKGQYSIMIWLIWVYSDPMPAYGTAGSMIQSLNVFRPKRKNMCVYGHPTHPIFQPKEYSKFKTE